MWGMKEIKDAKENILLARWMTNKQFFFDRKDWGKRGLEWVREIKSQEEYLSILSFLLSTHLEMEVRNVTYEAVLNKWMIYWKLG